LLGADCVHLGEDAVSVEDARRVLGDGSWVSRACHRAEDAATSGSDAVLLSPIAQARKGRPALGVAGLGAARAAVERARAARSDVSAHAESRRPLVYALGGVDAANAAECLAAGADGVAVIRAALDRRPIEPLLDALGIAK
jgi:thiamine-phosphate pyrophosphorylase